MLWPIMCEIMLAVFCRLADGEEMTAMDLLVQMESGMARPADWDSKALPLSTIHNGSDYSQFAVQTNRHIVLPTSIKAPY